MAHWLIVFGIAVLSRTSLAGKYDNYTLLQLFAANESQLAVLPTLEHGGDDGVEILKFGRDVDDSTDVLVPPDKMSYMKNFSNFHHLTMNVKEHNYARKLEFDREPKRRDLKGDPAFEYSSFEKINKALDDIEKRSKFLSLQYVGNSYQGRHLKLARISSNPNAHNPIIFIDAGIHAREWVAPAMAMYLINRLALDPHAKDDLDGIDWYILPVVNPDGYEHTRSNMENRMWRKTMSQQTASCYGVDGNRNYGYKWAVSGVSRNPCDKETYAGPRPFSEPETQIVKKIMIENAVRIKLYVSLHSYGQYLVYPWGYTGDRLPKSWRKLDRLAKIVSAATVRAGGPGFKVLSAGKWYPAAGGSDDFAFGGIGIPYSYTMELTEGHEFIYPQHLLPTVLPKYYQGFRAFANEIRREFSPIYGRQKRHVSSNTRNMKKLLKEWKQPDEDLSIPIETFPLFP